jgi:hypothetical protein
VLPLTAHCSRLSFPRLCAAIATFWWWTPSKRVVWRAKTCVPFVIAAIRIACFVAKCAFVFEVFTSNSDCNKLSTILSRTSVFAQTFRVSGGRSSLVIGLYYTERITAYLCGNNCRLPPKVLWTHPKIVAKSRRTNLWLTPSFQPPMWIPPPRWRAHVFAFSLLRRRDSHWRSFARSCAPSILALSIGPNLWIPTLLFLALALPISSCDTYKNWHANLTTHADYKETQKWHNQWCKSETLMHVRTTSM